MRFTRITLLASAAALLAACSDSPVSTRDARPSDLSLVTFSKGDGTIPVHPASSPATTPPGPRFICNPEYEECPTRLPRASFQYGSYTEQSTSGFTKSVHLVAWSDNYANIDDMELTAHFKSVGGDGSLGCSATPQQYEQDSTSGFGSWFVDHYTIYLENFASYPASSVFVWEVAGDHTFYASSGYGVALYSDVGTFYSSARVCY
ncbi:hypothetical protein [Longimicrobium sp.]|uniref:hypothetical protein n=1 Tax=Longimicrobium sp. TaxID=2029185 RepID=UPI002B7D0CEF|nr:hypothetical protein [Longimicrobium sp.]HSU13014.1 hypothetical protein [Longimicrobium sp.]